MEPRVTGITERSFHPPVWIREGIFTVGGDVGRRCRGAAFVARCLLAARMAARTRLVLAHLARILVTPKGMTSAPDNPRGSTARFGCFRWLGTSMLNLTGVNLEGEMHGR